MKLFSGNKHGWGSRIKRKLGLKKDDVSPLPQPVNARISNPNASAVSNKPQRAGPPKTVIAKPGISRTESERRDRLVEAPLSPIERRLQRADPRGTSHSLAPIHSRSVGDLNEVNEVDVRRLSNARQSWVGPSPKFIASPQVPATPSQVSQPLSTAATAATSGTGPTSETAVGKQSHLEHQPDNLERQTTSTLGATHSIDSQSNYEGPAPGGSDHDLKPLEGTPDWTWILNLSMHFRDHSHREKFFVTYAQRENVRRRVTVSCDYRDAEHGSLEYELCHLRSQKEKSNKIYESIKEALPDIQFYETTTNLKLQTDDGKLNVHVTEDMHEIIYYPPVAAIAHLDCEKISEGELRFDSHLSGFVYKVSHQGQIFIKKEIPSPDTVDEFLYEINALYALQKSQNVIRFGGCVLDDRMEKVKGLLISFAPKGALIDMLYNERGKLPWALKESWARQIIAGLADIHEAGYVQGDFTLSNIVIDEDDTAKIIDINRRGCPVGWEPPEITAMLAGLQRIGIYIGVKSDIFQLGMCLWGIAMESDEPEYEKKPLSLKDPPANAPECYQDVPEWYKEIVELCLAQTPQARPSAKSLLDKFPPHTPLAINPPTPPATSSHELFYERDPLSPMIVEAVAPFDDPNQSVPPSPALPQPQVEFVHLNGLQYQIPVPQMPHSPIADTVDNVETVSTTSNPALVATSTDWRYGQGSVGVGVNANGVASRQVKPAPLEIPSTSGGGMSAQNGKGKDPSTNTHITSLAAERAIKHSSGGGSASGSGRNSPAPARHTDSGFAEIAGEESPVSPKTVPAPKNQHQQNGKSNAGRNERT